MKSMSNPSTISRSVEIGLRMMGAWPDSPYSTFHRFFWTTTLGVAQTFQYRHVIMHVGTDDLAQLMDSLSTTMSYSLLFLKLVILWMNRRVFNDILVSMVKDWKECRTEWSVLTMINTAEFSHRISNAIIGLYSMSVILYATGVLVSQNDDEEDNVKVIDMQRRELFLKMEFPFESDSSPNYEIIMIVQFFHQLSAAALVGVLNALIITLILHVGGQIDIVRTGLEKISSKDIELELSDLAVKSLIKRHQDVIAFANNVELLFSYIALMQFLWNTLVICCLGYLVVFSVGSADGSTMLVKSLFFYAVITLEAFIFCFAGEYLSAKGNMIGDAAYEALWYDMKPKNSRILMLLILRSQKQLTITIGKFMDLSLERFTSIIRASASYISVLHAMS